MKKKTALRTHHAPHFYVLFAFVMIVVGAFGAVIVTKVVGQTANNSIYACAQKQTGNLRMVAAGTSCRPDETATSWNQQGPQGPAGPSGASATSNGLPYACTGNCDLGPYADKFAGKDFTGAELLNCYFLNADISGVIFKNGNLDGCNFINANLTGADLSNLVEPGYYNSQSSWNNNTTLTMTGSNLTNTNLSNDNLSGHFQNANLQNTNFSNAILHRVDFSGAHNMATSIVTGVTWDGVTCPDGTNSDDHGSTCVGHF